MTPTDQMLVDASHKRDLARQIRNQLDSISLASLRLRLIKHAESLEKEATALEAAARATKKRDAPKRQLGPRRKGTRASLA